jgi:hypothetical protein
LIAREAIQPPPNARPKTVIAIDKFDSPSPLADFIAGIIDATPAEKQKNFGKNDRCQGGNRDGVYHSHKCGGSMQRSSEHAIGQLRSF